MKIPFAAVLTLTLAPLAAAQDSTAWIEDARKVASSVPPKLLKVLNDEIAKSGHDGAIGVCREKAPQMTKAASEETGWAIRRVSLKNRNPKAVPDAWERAVLEDFDRRAAAGEKPPTFEKAEVVLENGKPMQRYMRALPVQEICLGCHGPVDQLTPAVSAKLKSSYPEDRGTGYKLGDIRGAMTIKKAM